MKDKRNKNGRRVRRTPEIRALLQLRCVHGGKKVWRHDKDGGWIAVCLNCSKGLPAKEIDGKWVIDYA